MKLISQEPHQNNWYTSKDCLPYWCDNYSSEHKNER